MASLVTLFLPLELITKLSCLHSVKSFFNRWFVRDCLLLSSFYIQTVPLKKELEQHEGRGGVHMGHSPTGTVMSRNRWLF